MMAVMGQRAAWCCVFLVLALEGATAAARVEPSMPSTSLQRPAATGSVAGQVIDADGRPVPRANVTCSPDGRGASVLTDQQGRFLFRDVPKGSLYLAAFKRGYVAGQYGKQWPFASGQKLELAEGQVAADLVLRIWKYAGISGRVLDDVGEPIVGATVRVFLITVVAGRSVFSFNTPECTGLSCLSTHTDDRGAYRFSVVPGAYALAVPSIAGSMPMSMQRLLLARGRPSSDDLSGVGTPGWLSGGGGVSSPISIGVGDARFALSDLDKSPTVASLTADGRLSLYQTQYYPLAPTPSLAKVIAVGSGEERTGLDFFLRAVRTVRVSGMIAGPTGPMPDLVLRLVPVDQEQLGSDVEAAATSSDVDGAFTFLGVAPGSYFVRAISKPRSPLPAGSVSPASQTSDQTVAILDMPVAPPRPGAAAPVLWTEARLSVGDTDVRGLQILLRPTPRVMGRIEFEGSTIRPAGRLPTVHVERADGLIPIGPNLRLASVDGQGGFATDGQPPGKYFVRMPFVPAGWTFKSAMLDGRDVSDVPLELEQADVSGIVIVLSDRPAATFTGTVRTAAAMPDPAAVVVVFPADRDAWVNVGEHPRRFGSAGTTAGGTYSVTGLPAGEYFVAALGGDTDVPWRAPAMLATLAATATRLTLAESERKTVNLTTRSVR
jgi:hypothetical protein